MNVKDRAELVRQVGQEVITDEDLISLLESGKHLVAYDGFEPSGTLHIGQGILRTININKMIRAGCKFKILVADWHAWANNKYGGDLDKIQKAGQLFIEIWKACGLDMKNVEFVWASDIVKDDKYWAIVMQVAISNTVNRIIRCSQIMGRSEKESLSAAQILYPCMQVADIFYLKANICQLGMDQRKVNVLAREIGEKLGYYKPVIVSNPMIMGLGEPPKDVHDPVERAIAMKMSKSNLNSAIFMTDSSEAIHKKISKAYCPAKQVVENPILEYCKYLIFESMDKIGEFEIQRPEKFGGNLVFESYVELEKAFADGSVHPMDLKSATARYIDVLISPVREHFENDKKAGNLLLEVQGFEVTR